MEANLEYMFKNFGFYFPDAEYLTDPEGLLKYLVSWFSCVAGSSVHLWLHVAMCSMLLCACYSLPAGFMLRIACRVAVLCIFYLPDAFFELPAGFVPC